MSYTAFNLNEKSKSKLLELFPPKYNRVCADHVTLDMGINNVSKIMTRYPNPLVTVYGYVTDGDSIETVLVSLNNDITRKDGRKFHITLSLDPSKGRKPVDSNKIIELYDFLPIDHFNLTGEIVPVLVV